MNQESPHFRIALSAVVRADANAAAFALGGIEGSSSQQLAVEYVQLEWLRHGHAVSGLVPLHELIRARVEPENVERPWFVREWADVWIDAVGIHLDAKLLQVYRASHPALALLRAVVTLCARGEPQAALPLALAVSQWEKEERAAALALVATQFVSPQREELLALALAAPDGPFIQNGGEEVTAYARIARVLADAGFAGNDPAVELTYRKLQQLLQADYIPDAQEGNFQAGFVAAVAARRLADPEWLAHAQALDRPIFIPTANVQSHLHILIAQAEYAFGDEEPARRKLRSINDRFFGGERLGAHLRQALLTQPDEFVSLIGHRHYPIREDLAILVTRTGAPELVDDTFQSLEVRKSLRYGLMLAFDREGHENYAARKLDEQDIGEGSVLAVMIAARIGNEERLRQRLAELEPKHVDFIWLPEIIKHLDLPFLRNLEAIFHEGNALFGNAGLLTLAAHHWRHEHWADAQRCVALAILPRPPEN